MVTGAERLIDFHCHVSRSGGVNIFSEPRQSEIADADNEFSVVAMTNTPSEWQTLSRENHGHRVLWAIGLHPGERQTGDALSAFQEGASKARAIGEVGLDYRRGTVTSPVDQRRSLAAVLESIEGMKKIVSVHSVSAADAIIDMLAKSSVPGCILHWFLGSPRDIDRAVDLDMFFSVNERMLRSSRGRAVMGSLPPNRVLLETDAPFGVQRTEIPIDVRGALASTLRSVATMWALPIDEAREQIIANQRAIFARAPDSDWSRR